MTAYVIGNGNSRRSIDLKSLHGITYGCNSLYLDFKPHCLVATDVEISRHIQEIGYAKHNRFHTRKVFADSGARPLLHHTRGWSSGPNALALAIHDRHRQIYILGFDFGGKSFTFNNVYADTEFYKKSTDPATFGGNWVNQVDSLLKQHHNVNFYIVYGRETSDIRSVFNYRNVSKIGIDEFRSHK